MAPAKPLLRIGIVIIAMLAGVALVEGTLQIAGVFTRAGALAPPPDLTGETRPIVAFCGDSNMYGLYLENPNATLPKQIEDLSLKSTGGANSEIRTVNFGVPASPSWVVLEQVERALLLKPVAVVARAGINNTWQVPPGEGAGFFEKLKLVKLYRLWTSNRKTAAKVNTLGPGGKALTDAEVEINDHKSEMRLAPRDAAAAPFEIQRPLEEKIGFERASGRLRADFLEMAEKCNKAGARLFLLTYLEGYQMDFEPIRQLILTLKDKPNITVVDCSPWLQQAVNGPAAASAPATAPALSRELALARRSQLVTRDCHPTALGYGVEARALAKELAAAGILKSYRPEDPLTPYRKTEIEIPKLKTGNSKLAFEVSAKGGDRVSLVAGLPGESLYKETIIPLDWKSLQLRPPGISQPIVPVQETGPAGRAEMRVPERVASALPAGTRLIAVIERGGQFGAARIFISNTIEWRPGVGK